MYKHTSIFIYKYKKYIRFAENKSRIKKISYITRTVLTLSVVSFFTDVSSEMLYPILPVYLSSIGFSALLIGFLDGLADAVASLTKGYFGSLSDYYGERKKYVFWGYFLSAVSKPMLAVSKFSPLIFSSRSLDKLGKGMRTAPRDAMLADESNEKNRGRVFGFHRAMDTFGAAVGPALALLYLYYYPHEYQSLFILAFFPALIAAFSVLLVKEKKVVGENTNHRQPKPKLFSFIKYFSTATKDYKKLVGGLLVFALLHSPDTFILLYAKHCGMDDIALIGLYIYYNLVYASAAFPAGIFSDKFGMKKTFLTGILFFTTAYFTIYFSSTLTAFIFCYTFLGLYSAFTEGCVKAWISNMTNRNGTATAIGFYTGLNSIAVLFAGIFAGLMWDNFSPHIVFISSSLGGIFTFIFIRNIKFAK